MPAASGEGAAGWRSPQPLSLRGTQRQPGARGSSQTPSPAHGGSGRPCTWVLADYAHPPAFPTCACSLHACVLPSTHPQPPKHTQTNVHTDPAAHTHTPTPTSPPAHMHAHTAHQGSSAQACTSTHTHAHTRSGWGCSHTQARCSLHACRNKDTLSSASHTQACCGAHTPAQTRTPAPQWLTHACTHTQTQPGVLTHASAVWLPGTQRQGHSSPWLSHTPVQPWSSDTLHPAPACLGLPTASCSPDTPGWEGPRPPGGADHTYTETECSAHT